MWPVPIYNLTIMHRKWTQDGDSVDSLKWLHLRSAGFAGALKKLRPRNHERIKAVAHIPLPF